MMTPDDFMQLSYDENLRLIKENSRLRARNEVLEAENTVMRSVMKKIAFKGGDAPFGISEASFYRLQLYICVSAAANALAKLEQTNANTNP